jgi:hypothetical protein
MITPSGGYRNSSEASVTVTDEIQTRLVRVFSLGRASDQPASREVLVAATVLQVQAVEDPSIAPRRYGTRE